MVCNMRVMVVAGGPGVDIQGLRQAVQEANRVLAVDSGAEYLRQIDVIPAELWGDMDSISTDTLRWAEDCGVPRVVFPAEKDMTDAELCLRGVDKEAEILFVSSLTGRPDHVLSNLLLIGRLTDEGYRLTMTDGLTWIFPVKGSVDFRIPEVLVSESAVVSLLPLFENAEGVYTKGLYYPLHDATLIPGSSFSVSNRVGAKARDSETTKNPDGSSSGVCADEQPGFVIRKGIALVFVTPAV